MDKPPIHFPFVNSFDYLFDLIEVYWNENLGFLDQDFITSINYFIDFATTAWI